MVTGTHGKTTVSCLLSWVLEQCGLSPGFMIGGVGENLNTSFRFSPASSWFVVEGDEYDTAFFEKTPKFMHYPATHIIVTNAEFDHADIYRDFEQVKAVFRSLVKKQAALSHPLIMGCDSPFMQELAAEVHPPGLLTTYGAGMGDYQMISRQPMRPSSATLSSHSSKKLWKISVKEPDGQIQELILPLPGRHNALNALAVWAFARSLKLNPKLTKAALKSFKGVRRRLQALGTFNKITLVEDFAHHPTAVKAAIASVREMYPARRLLALFEPRSNTSRTNIFQKEYEQALSPADLVFCMPAFKKSSPPPPSKSFCVSQLIKNLKARHIPAFTAPDVQTMTHTVTKHAKKGDIILMMSNGDFGNIYSLLKKTLAFHTQS